MVQTSTKWHIEAYKIPTKDFSKAEKWLLTSRQSNILSEKFVKLLHKKMYESVWKWASKFRTKEVNIGKVALMLFPLKYLNE